jgi:hypothetical protein
MKEPIIKCVIILCISFLVFYFISFVLDPNVDDLLDPDGVQSILNPDSDLDGDGVLFLRMA